MTLRALIFDVDGTLAETEEAHRLAFNHSFSVWKLDWHWGPDLYRELLGVTGGKERVRAYQNCLPQEAGRLTDDEIAQLHKDKTAHYGEILARGELALRPGVDALMQTARKAGLKLAVATTTNQPNVAALTRACWHAEPGEVFDVIAAGDEVARKKPAPDVFQLALARLGMAADDCVAFEDSLNGLRSAMGAGLATLVTPSIYTDDQDFSAAADVRPSLAGLSLSDLEALLRRPGP